MSIKANEQEINQRIQGLVKFAKSVLHLPFPELDLVNPSFTVLAKTCDLIAALLRANAQGGQAETAEEVAGYMRDIATAIVDRDDKAVIDSMCILDQFLESNQVTHLGSASIKAIK
ncbi:hypothetical protein KP803_18110 [Vibrio sp. ZSDE26]|uniref:Uncharacterized protein n=1 Tax=Vibrio amylolyticus TaxID=2847292 RepID=A0A9X1XQD1_9VIBR|nr:hypothetical protein [Vibrio amylolyticus]MCK6265195.1 hypothetical protein [Vibrio amylolyticus]